MGEEHKGCRTLCCVLHLLLISHACTGSRCTNTAHCNVVQIMDLCSFQKNKTSPQLYPEHKDQTPLGK